MRTDAIALPKLLTVNELFEQYAKCVKTEEEKNVLSQSLRDAHAKLLQLNSERTGAAEVAATTAGVWSLPENRNLGKDKRQKTPWSAEKKRKKRKPNKSNK